MNTFKRRLRTDLVLAEDIAIADLMDQRIGNLTSSASDDDSNGIFSALDYQSMHRRKSFFNRILITDADMIRERSKGDSR